MNMWKKYVLVFAALMIVSACGGENKAPPKHRDNVMTPSEVNKDDDSRENEHNNDTNLTDEQNENDETDLNDANDLNGVTQDEEVKIEYRMNSIYDIVPIDEATNRDVVLLTFDDGPKDEQMVQEMLDILDQHQAKAIFFVNGYRVKQNPELLKLIDERGHPIGNHSWDHIVLRDLGEEEVDQQIGDVQNIVEELTGKRPLFFRPPNGAGSDIVRAKVAAEEMLFMTWSNGSLDWEYDDPDAVIEQVMEQLRPGSNILMHELPWTIEALDELLTKISEEGYDFVDPLSIQITE